MDITTSINGNFTFYDSEQRAIGRPVAQREFVAEDYFPEFIDDDSFSMPPPRTPTPSPSITPPHTPTPSPPSTPNRRTTPRARAAEYEPVPYTCFPVYEYVLGSRFPVHEPALDTRFPAYEPALDIRSPGRTPTRRSRAAAQRYSPYKQRKNPRTQRQEKAESAPYSEMDPSSSGAALRDALHDALRAISEGKVQRLTDGDAEMQTDAGLDAQIQTESDIEDETTDRQQKRMKWEILFSRSTTPELRK
ncbi:hypothetical protein EW145_g6238 [Phellinidium pouzarii]|uniref:Uncharacterized protein n=1 Tax=Phellinidium pouzarii TaxID=167371 RepID=A0A4S4KX71_9AGAM|nr:hypothetical protein EW145_g6238 [Phellinidium pouzarii]